MLRKFKAGLGTVHGQKLVYAAGPADFQNQLVGSRGGVRRKKKSITRKGNFHQDR